MTLVLVAAEKPRAEAPGRDAKVCVDELGPSVGRQLTAEGCGVGL